MNEQQNSDEARKRVVWGLVLAWSTFVPVAVGLVSNFHGRSGPIPTGLHEIAGSVVIAFTVFGFAVTSFPKSQPLFSCSGHFP